MSPGQKVLHGQKKRAEYTNVQITEDQNQESRHESFYFHLWQRYMDCRFRSYTFSYGEKHQFKITMYPNPFQDHFVLEFEKELSATVEMYDVQENV